MTIEEYRKTYAAYGVSYADHCIQARLDMSPQGFRDYVEERKRLENHYSYDSERYEPTSEDV
jgi:hypothetical protein